MQIVKAIAGTIYFTIALIALLTLGPPITQSLAITAAVFAGLSQVILQGSTYNSEFFGQLSIVIALAFTATAIISFVVLIT